MRMPLFLPEQEFNNLIGYVLGYVLEKYRVGVSVGCVTLDRWCLVGNDPACERSAVLQEFDSLLARAFNTMVDRHDAPVFGPPPGDHARLCDEEVMLEEMVACLAMPVADGLVDQGRKWPGLRFGPESWGVAQTYTRPNFFFSESMPEQTSFTPEPPKGFGSLSDAALAEKLRRAVLAEEERLREAHEENGRRILTRKELTKLERGVRLDGQPAVRPARERFRAADAERWEQEAERHESFLREHEIERQKMLSDDVPNSEVCFPEGTYWWRRFSSFLCEERVEREVFAPP